jgi:hypothetical protein
LVFSRRPVSRALMIQLSTGKQYSGDSYFREQGFIQTNLHSTLPWILMPVSSTLASQEFTQAFPKPCSPCDGSQPMKGVQLSPRGVPHGCFQCGSGLVVHQRHPVVVRSRGMLSSGSCLHIRASGRTLTAHGLRSGGE